MMEPTRKYLRRREAAQYLTERYFKTSHSTLAKLAVYGTGPEYRLCGRYPVYEPSALDAWAESRIGKPVTSTSQYEKGEAA